MAFTSKWKPSYSSIPFNTVWWCLTDNSLVQNKVEIIASKAWGWPSLPLVLVRSSITSSKNNQSSNEHHWKPNISTPARRHYSSRRKSHAAEIIDKTTFNLKKKKSWLKNLILLAEYSFNPPVVFAGGKKAAIQRKAVSATQRLKWREEREHECCCWDPLIPGSNTACTKMRRAPQAPTLAAFVNDKAKQLRATQTLDI